MASGYVDLPHDTYSVWKNATLGNEYDLDSAYGCQCWDYASLFWRNVGFGVGYPLTGPQQYASECWTVSRESNKGDLFDLIYNLSDVKTGDIIVLNGNVSNPPGHIAFADEDYGGGAYIWAIGQNQGGTPSPSGGTAVTRNQVGVGDFLGAFRYKPWHEVPPVPSLSKKHFPWVLRSRSLNQMRNMV